MNALDWQSSGVFDYIFCYSFDQFKFQRIIFLFCLYANDKKGRRTIGIVRRPEKKKQQPTKET